jgi:two-component system, NtrC family, response regulator AtoC
MDSVSQGWVSVPGPLSSVLPPEHIVFGASAVMQSVRQIGEKIASSDIPVLIQGPNGSGKEVLARWIHGRSARARHRFVKVNCPAIPGDLLESELFGYESALLPGATTGKPGRLELAHDGTLFLDEISEIGGKLQVKLLPLLQDGQFSRPGSVADLGVEVRLICASSRQMDREVEQGRFRRDVFYRINSTQIRLPSLAERLEDIPVLAQYFVQFHSRRYSLRVPPLPPSVLRLMQKHSWPGNIRELQNLMERYVILGSEEPLVQELCGISQENGGASGRGLKKVTRQTVRDFEHKLILDALTAHRWNRKMAAKELGISYRTLFYKLRQAGLAPRREPA